jgi:hypothetical protein
MLIKKIKLMKLIIQLIFGVRAQGEPVQQPTFRSFYPTERPDESQWAREMKFGSRYGHRGSFYQSR